MSKGLFNSSAQDAAVGQGGQGHHDSGSWCQQGLRL